MCPLFDKLGCGTFIAKTSKITSYDRYMPVSNSVMMLDKWKGNLYIVDGKSDDRYWKPLATLKPKDDNEIEDDD